MQRQSSGSQFVLRAAVVVCACGWSVSFALANGKAYVISGNEDSASEVSANNSAADSAEANYVAKGYMVMRLNQPTRAQIIAAFQDPNARAVWFVGHGGKNPNTGFVPYLAHNTKADPNGEAGIRPGDLGAGALNHLRQVVFQACGQDLQSWRDKFPNAGLTGWTGSVRSPTIRFDEYWYGRGRIPAKNPQQAAANTTLPVDPRLDQAVVYTNDPNDPTVQIDSGRNGFNFLMPPSLAASWGSHTFNVLIRDPGNPSDTQLLFGLTGSGGQTVDVDLDGYSSPDFVYELSPLAYQSATANVDFIQFAMQNGYGQITSNFTSVDAQTLFDGASYLVWSVPTPGTGVMLGLGLLAAVRRRR